MAADGPRFGRAGQGLAWLLVVIVAGGADGPGAPAKFEGRSIPDPPRQGQPWTPPATRLPRFLARATADLFAQGVADPRGCEYREVELADGWLLLSTRGFALPERPGDAGRFAVGWDGVIHPAAKVGPAADLDADIRGLARSMKADREAAAAAGRGARSGPAWGFGGTGGGGNFRPFEARPRGPASVETRSALKVCVLLRLGRADLAEELFAAGTTWKAEPGRLDLTRYGISELTLASEWASRAYNRAVDAHGLGDDAIALDGARRVAAFVGPAEARLAGLQFPHPRRQGPGPPSYFPDLGQLGALLADQERRARETARGPIPGPEAKPEARVAALIRDLDQIVGSGGMINGMAWPTGSTTERDLVAEGDAAVEPLLAVLESDDRLTRTISYPGSRHGGDDRSISSVQLVARSALTGILRTRVIPGSTGHVAAEDRPGRAREAAAIRAAWARNRGVPEIDRYFRDLGDNAATPEQWLDAAEALSEPADVRGRGGSYRIPYRVGGKIPGPRGEPLRDRRNPSVTDLIARRCESLDPTAPFRGAAPAGRQGQGLQQANRMARFLAAWDPKGALPTLKARVLRIASIVQASGPDHDRSGGLEAEIARMTLLRQDAGDPGALDDYAAWIRTVSAEWSGFFPSEMFEPMWREPDHPAIASAARALFDDPKSPWVPLFRPLERGWAGDAFKSGLISSPMLGVEPFRKLVLAGLADLRASGSVSVDAQGKIAEKLDDGTTQFPDPPRDDPRRPGPGTSMPLRLADMYCWKLQDAIGPPRIELHWPEADRDRAIAGSIEFLARYGPRFRFRDDPERLRESSPFDPQHQKAALTFDPLDHAATPEDVRAGLAMFSLDGAEARTFPLPGYPLRARWTGLTISPADPGLRALSAPTPGQLRSRTESLQLGLVWQAEEAIEAGQRRRYYGFANRLAFARVPAEEVEFPSAWNIGWHAASAELEARVIPPGGFDDGRQVVHRPALLGSPLPVEVWLRNRRGIDSAAPADWARTEGGLSLRDGLTIRLYRRPVPPAPAPGLASSRPPEDEIAARAVPRHRDGQASLTLGPARSGRVLQIDLRDLFPIDAPGQYRLTIESDALEPVEGATLPPSATFTLLKAGEKGIEP